MIGLDKGKELIVGRMKAHVEKPESQAEVWDGFELVFAYRTVFPISFQEAGEVFIGYHFSRPAEMDVEAQVLPERHDIVHEPAVTHKIEIEKSDRVALEMKVLGKEIKVTIAARKSGCIELRESFFHLCGCLLQPGEPFRVFHKIRFQQLQRTEKCGVDIEGPPVINGFKGR